MRDDRATAWGGDRLPGAANMHLPGRVIFAPPGVRPLVKNTIADICSPRLGLSFSYRSVFGVRTVGYYDYSNIVVKAKDC